MTSTRICKYIQSGEPCPYNSRCFFSHEKRPCWFFNNGGCNKKDDECLFSHVILSSPPCYYFHVCLKCTKDFCTSSHSELSQQEWYKHFPSITYPGINYTKKQKDPFPLNVYRVRPKAITISENSKWRKPLEFKQEKSQEKKKEIIWNRINFVNTKGEKMTFEQFCTPPSSNLAQPTKPIPIPIKSEHNKYEHILPEDGMSFDDFSNLDEEEKYKWKDALKDSYNRDEEIYTMDDNDFLVPDIIVPNRLIVPGPPL